MAKHLQPKHVQGIVNEINAFDGKITWDDVLDIIEEETSIRYKDYRGLYKHDDIVTAYKENHIRDEKGVKNHQGSRKKSAEVRKLEERIEKLKAEKQFLESINAQLNEKFLIWAHNAASKKLTEADLEGSGHLPLIDRQPTEV